MKYVLRYFEVPVLGKLFLEVPAPEAIHVTNENCPEEVYTERTHYVQHLKRGSSRELEIC